MLYIPQIRDEAKGFSLVEVTLALGVIVFALVALIGMVGVGLSTSKDSVADTRTSAIASRVFEKAGAELATSASFASPSSPWQGNFRDYWFDDQGTETSVAAAKAYRARVTLVAPLGANQPTGVSANSLKALTIEVAWPVVNGALITNTNSVQKRSFSLLLRNPANKGAYP
jgi:uncharacterized protein (TIGR02598 family)